MGECKKEVHSPEIQRSVANQFQFKSWGSSRSTDFLNQMLKRDNFWRWGLLPCSNANGWQRKACVQFENPKSQQETSFKRVRPSVCDSAETLTHPNCLQSLVFTGWTFFEDGKHVKIQVNQCFLLLFKVTYLVSIKIIMQQKSARIELPITSWSKKEKGVEMQKQLIWLCEVKWRVDWNQLDKNGNSFKFEKDFGPVC